MSWIAVGLATLVYWILLFVRMRARGRQDFARAIEDAAATHAPDESFEVTVPITIKPLRMAVVVLAPPLMLVLLHFLTRHGTG